MKPNFSIPLACLLISITGALSSPSFCEAEWKTGPLGQFMSIDTCPPPTKAIGMGKNVARTEEKRREAKPYFFLRSATSIGHSGDPIPMPTVYENVSYEGELVIIIGKRATAVSPREAEKYILGYTCGMDGSPQVLDEQGVKNIGRSIAGKSCDGIAPIGPRVVRELGAEGHAIILRVNGVEVERSNTNELVWDPARAVSEISQSVTLEPGDVIFAGAGQAIPGMKIGDVVEVEIEGISFLKCPVVRKE